jgi:flagella basal body P-ring formation protein FlgA
MLGEGLTRRPEAAIGKQLQASLQAGSLLYDKILKAPPLVKRGDRVIIRAKSAHLQINVNGEIQNTGGQGDQVRVKNLMSRKELYARVITPTVVEVEY